MMNLSPDTQYKLLSQLSEGDVFEHGTLFNLPGAERLVWSCEESTTVMTDAGESIRCTLHLYYRGVMLRALVAWLDPVTQRVEWRPYV